MNSHAQPSHASDWREFPMWRLATRKSVCGLSDEPLLSVYLNRGVIPYFEGGGLVHKPAESLEKYQLVEPGDFVLNNQQAWRGSVGVSDHRGIVSPAYLVLSLNQDLIDARFASYLFRDRFYVDKYMLASMSVGDIQRQVKWQQFRSIGVSLPNLATQRALANLLDRRTSRIDELLFKKHRLIALLREKRATAISWSVTKGISPCVSFQSSGLKSIGDIPSHWTLSPVGRALRQTKRIVGDRHGTYKLLSLTTKGVIERNTSENSGKFPESFETYQEVRSGQFVFCLFDIDETPRTVGCSTTNGMITGAYAVFDCVQSAYARFLYYLFLHFDTCKGLKPYYTGLRKTIRPAKFASIRIPFPPAAEAEAIAVHLDEQTNRIDRLVARTERSIELLKEHRSALITAAVTGKIDVRGFAAENMKAAA